MQPADYAANIRNTVRRTISLFRFAQRKLYTLVLANTIVTIGLLLLALWGSPVVKAFSIIGIALIALGAVPAALAIVEKLVADRVTDEADYIGRRTKEHKAYKKGMKLPSPDDLLDSLQYLHNKFEIHDSLLSEVAHHAEQLDILNTVAATVNSTLDLQQVFNTALTEVLNGFNWNKGSIYMWDDRTATLNLVSYAGLPVDLLRRSVTLKVGEGIAGQAAKTQQIIVQEDARGHAQYEGLNNSELPVTQVTIPLVAVSGGLLGILQVGNSEIVGLTDQDLNVLSTVAHQVALAIDKAQLYQAVTEHAEDLENIVRERTSDLAKAIKELSVALDKAKEADKVKSLLLSTVSHELRTPLATIKGNTSLLREHHISFDENELVAHLTDIEEETDKLTELISSLLEMSRLDAGVLHIQRETVDTQDILESTVNSARIRLPDHDIKIGITSRLPMAYADSRRIEQVIANLLDNAAKYSEPRTSIEVEATSDDEFIYISVTDQGVGIAPDHITQIFDRFYQITTGLSSGDSIRKGIGLGLAICKGLVEAHNGRIWVESTVGEGAKFTFSLPIATRKLLLQGEKR